MSQPSNMPTAEFVRRSAAQIEEGHIALLLQKRAALDTKVLQSRGRLRKQEHKLQLLWWLLEDWQAGKYQSIDWSAVRLAAYVFHYLLEGKDLIPDAVPVAGLSDDIAVLVLVWSEIEPALEAYATWKGLIHHDYFCIND